jgi:hypothetical protein
VLERHKRCGDGYRGVPGEWILREIEVG